MILAVLGTLTVTMTASTTVPSSRAGLSVQARLIKDLAPAGCASLTLTKIVIRTGNYTTSVSGALILGGSGVDKITDNGNYNCVVGGGGKDVIKTKSTSKCRIGPNGTTGPHRATYRGCATFT